MELEVAPGVMKAPGWHLCLSCEQKVCEGAMDLIRTQCMPLAAALDQARNDQEHRMFHWVQLFMQPGHQRAISAPLSSSSSSSSAKRSAGAASPSQSSEVTALSSKLDTGCKGRDRSRSPRGAQKKTLLGKGKARGGGPKGKGSRFEDLLKQHRDRFVLKREGQEVCYKFQDEKKHRPRLLASSCVRRLRPQHFVERVPVLEVGLKQNSDPGRP